MSEIQKKIDECLLFYKKAEYQAAIKSLEALEKKYTHFSNTLVSRSILLQSI